MKRFFGLFLEIVALLMVTGAAARAQLPRESEEGGRLLAYIGTYTGGASRGISGYRFDASSGESIELGLVAEIRNPSFLALHPNGRFLYAVSEADDYDARSSGSVSSYAVNRQTGELTLLNQVSSEGRSPCHLSLDRTGRMLAVANYGDGRVAAFPVRADGSLGEVSTLHQHEGSSVHPRRQRGPHAHSIDFSPDNRLAVSADLGLDKLLLYRVDPAKGSLQPADPDYVPVSPGAGPRHFAFHPSGPFAYVINELQSTVTSFRLDSGRGVLREIQTVSTLPKDFEGESYTAEIGIHPSGDFLYGSNRGHDSIAVFSINGRDGLLNPIEHVSTRGERPRHFAITPDGSALWAANQSTGNIVLFRIDAEQGTLRDTGRRLLVDSPVCILFLPVP